MRISENVVHGVLLAILTASMAHADNSSWITVEGKLWRDSNGDGLFNAGELPIPDWTVQADRLYQTKTSTDGTYSLTIPDDTDYRILARWADHWQQTSPASLQDIEYRYGGTQVLSPSTADGSAEVTALETDALGNLYLAGHFEGRIDFDPGSGEDLQSSQTGKAFVTKINADQSYAWTIVLPGVSEAPAEMSMSSNQNLFIVGKMSFNRGYVTRIDPQTGALSWSRQFQNCFPYGLGTTPDQTIYVTGTFRNSVDFDPNETSTDIREAKGQSDLFLMCLSDEGKMIWTQTTGHRNALALGQRVRIDSEQNIFVAGYFRYEMDFDPGTQQDLISSHGDEDSFVCRYNSDGSYAWTFHIKSSYSNKLLDLEIDNLDRLVLVGHYNYSTTFGQNGPYISSTDGTCKAFVLQLDTDGNMRWVETLDSAIAGTDMSHFCTAATGVCVDGLNTIHVVGERIIDPDGEDYEFFDAPATNTLFIWQLNSEGESVTFERLNQISTTEPTYYYYEPLTWDVTVDALGDVIIGGRFGYSTDLAPGAVRDMFVPQGQTDAFILTLERLHGTYQVAPSSSSLSGMDFGFIGFDPNPPSDPNGGTGEDPNDPPIDVVPL